MVCRGRGGCEDCVCPLMALSDQPQGLLLYIVGMLMSGEASRTLDL